MAWTASCWARTPTETAAAAAAAAAAFALLHRAADIANTVLDGVDGILLGAHIKSNCCCCCRCSCCIWIVHMGM
jgi:phage protein D